MIKIFRIVLWALIAVVVVGLGAFSYLWQRDIQTADGPFGVPFSLVDQRGDKITETAFRDKPVAIFFGFTHCPEICPTTLYELDGWLDAADPSGEKIAGYFVSVDPERDTAEVLDLYVGNVSDRVVGITGDPDDVFEMLKGYKVYFKKVPSEDEADDNYNMDHTASVFLFNNGGRFKGTIAYGENPDTAIQKLENLLKE